MKSTKSSLPIMRSLGLSYFSSIAIALMMTVSSLMGILSSEKIYPSSELIQAFVPNDIVNLVIALPILVISIWLTSKNKLSGLLLWPGALFYVFYTYFIYVFAMPLSTSFAINLTLVTLSMFSMIDLLTCIDSTTVQAKLSENIPERMAGGVLTGLGVLFLLRVIVIIISSIVYQTPIPRTELALHVSDFLISPAVIIGGILLWQLKRPGYIIGLGLLFQQSMLFIGLIAVLILQPFILGVAFAYADVIIVFIMGLVCFIPFLLFARGSCKVT